MHWYSESKNQIFQSFETYAPITEEKNFQQNFTRKKILYSRNIKINYILYYTTRNPKTFQFLQPVGTEIYFFFC